MSEPLPICSKCGWYAHGPYRTAECDPIGGAAADKLIAAVPEVPSTKFGYGYPNFVFEQDDNFHVRLQVSRPTRAGYVFALEDVWLLDDLSHEDAVDLVKTLAAWRTRQLERRDGYECTCLRHDLPKGHHTHACAERNRERAVEASQ
jgi:hypothetical protein